ncbi:hypothetical protein [Oceanibaculum indicum]|uniref:Uncharacterized protein n=1 Tax=Oceanibaculum indicum TaxID=526216 RepID=A0A420WGL8_9PROT|nr:hypothetical protein [Oceanibaculum indicum]RKQ70099.1 hypothetical protein BCL74_2037 [Oceanibaculum indicum]
MSEAAIQAFLGDLAKDEGLQAQVRELLPANPGKPEVSAAILAVARRSGFDVDAGDAAIVERALVEAPRTADGELDEAALEQAAGGVLGRLGSSIGGGVGGFIGGAPEWLLLSVARSLNGNSPSKS